MLKSLWVEMIGKLVNEVDAIQEIPSTKIIKPFKIKLTSNILENVSQYIDLTVFAEEIIEKYKDLPITAIISCNNTIKEKYEFISESYESCKDRMESYYLKILNTFIEEAKRGLSGFQIPGKYICQICETNLQGENQEIQLILFHCDHSFHKECVKSVVNPLMCPICIETQINLGAQKYARKRTKLQSFENNEDDADRPHRTQNIDLSQQQGSQLNLKSQTLDKMFEYEVQFQESEDILKKHNSFYSRSLP